MDNVLPCLGSDVNEDSKCRVPQRQRRVRYWSRPLPTASQSVPHTAIRAHARCVLPSFGKNLYNIKEQNFGVVEETPQAKEFVPRKMPQDRGGTGP